MGAASHVRAPSVGQEIMTLWTQGADACHYGRAADTYSYGIVMFEVMSRLVRTIVLGCHRSLSTAVQGVYRVVFRVVPGCIGYF